MSIVPAADKVDTAEHNIVMEVVVVVGPEVEIMVAKTLQEVTPSKAVQLQVPEEILGVAVVTAQADSVEEVLPVSMREAVVEDTLAERAARIRRFTLLGQVAALL